jgi:hypothetical protein
MKLKIEKQLPEALAPKATGQLIIDSPFPLLAPKAFSVNEVNF